MPITSISSSLLPASHLEIPPVQYFCVLLRISAGCWDVLVGKHAVLFLPGMNWIQAKRATEESIADTDLVRHYVDLVGSEEDVVDNKTDSQAVVPVSSSPSSSPWVSKRSALALQTAMSLISMTSPRNFQLRSTALPPSFVEFDMSMEGYGYCCCFFSL